MSLPELNDCLLDHVAIAVKSIVDAKKIFEDIGLVFQGPFEEVQDQKVLTAFAQMDTHAHLELLEPTSEESTIYKFLQTRGPGIHHLCFKVSNLELKTQHLIDRGYKMIYPAPRPGAGGCLVNFLHPKSTGGILIELSQKLAPEVLL